CCGGPGRSGSPSGTCCGAWLVSGEARRPGGFRIALGTVHRWRRLQLIAIVVATVGTVLAASQWLDSRLSESALDRDLEARALLYLRTVASLWGRTGAGALRRAL